MGVRWSRTPPGCASIDSLKELATAPLASLPITRHGSSAAEIVPDTQPIRQSPRTPRS